jgi:hypothetical protein
MKLFARHKRELLSAVLRPDRHTAVPVPYVHGMISYEERDALASFAKNIWSHGAPRDAVLVDAGSFIGTSTVALAEGLRQSPLPEPRRRGRIWCYDRFEATTGMVVSWLPDSGLRLGDSFRFIFDRNVSAYTDYLTVCAGDILSSPVPARPIAILFVDMAWSWDVNAFLSRNFFPLLSPGRSLLIHQDFAYPFYPWVVLSMAQLEEFFEFAYNVPLSTVVFDVRRRIRSSDIDDPRNVPVATALGIYDKFMARLQGSPRAMLALGKAFYLASLNRIEEAQRLTNEILAANVDDPLVVHHVKDIRFYCNQAIAAGSPRPLEQAVGY